MKLTFDIKLRFYNTVKLVLKTIHQLLVDMKIVIKLSFQWKQEYFTVPYRAFNGLVH